MRSSFLGIAALLVCAPTMGFAQMYRCDAENGAPVFSDLPCGDKQKVVEPKPASGGSSINPVASLRVQHYQVKGTTTADLLGEIRAKGPDGWWGTAHTRITYLLTTRQTRDGCAVDTVRALANSHVRLPLWVNRYEAPVATQTYFDRAFRSLDYHERGHVQISLNGARELERSILSIPAQPTCEQLRAEAGKVNRAVLALVREQQTLYDLETNHGVEQSPYR